MGVVGPAHPRDYEPETFVQTASIVVRAADFQRRALGPERRPFGQDAMEQGRRNPLPPPRRQDREIIDVQLVEDAPERAEPDDTSLGVARQEEERHAPVVELGEVHLARPRIAERGLLDAEDVLDFRRRREGLDLPRRHPLRPPLRASRAISASGRRTYNGWIPAGSSAAPASARRTAS